MPLQLLEAVAATWATLLAEVLKAQAAAQGWWFREPLPGSSGFFDGSASGRVGVQSVATPGKFDKT